MARRTHGRSTRLTRALCAMGATVAATSAFAVPTQAASGSAPIELAALPGFSDSFAYAINDAGTVVGSASNSGGPPFRAVKWDRDGRVTQLALPADSQNSTVAGINNDGIIAGAVDTEASPANVWRPVRWDRDGRLTTLESLPGSTSSLADDINDVGEVMGLAQMPDGPHVVRWDAQGQVTSLPYLPDHTLGELGSINDEGTVTATTCLTVGGCRAVRWGREGRVEDLGTLPGYDGSAVLGMNNHGVVIGRSWKNDGYTNTPARWNPVGVIAALPLPPSEYTEGLPTAVNDLDLVVGYVSRTDGLGRAAMWDRRNHLTLLHMRRNWTSSGAADVNDSGIIAGTASTTTGTVLAVRWDRTGRIVYQGSFPTVQGAVVDLNETGAVVGWAYGADGQAHALLWR